MLQRPAFSETPLRSPITAVLAALTLTLMVLRPNPVFAQVEGPFVPPPTSASTSGPPEGILTLPATPAPVIARGFAGMAANGTYIPPDTHGASGPNGVLAVVNSRIAYYGNPGYAGWGPVALSSLFASSTGELLDTKSLYDPASGRFFVVSLELNDAAKKTYVNLAVSKDSDPSNTGSGEWYTYRVDATIVDGTVSYGIDYTCIGVDGQGVYATYNMADLPFRRPAGQPSPQYWRTRIFAFSKSAVKSGSLQYTSTLTPLFDFSPYTLQPATVVSGAPPSNVAYFVSIPRWATNVVRVYALSNPITVPTLTYSDVTVSGHTGDAANAPQLGTADLIDANSLSFRAMNDVAWQNRSLWVVQTGAGDFPERRGIVYYYRIATNGFPSGTPTRLEDGGIDGGAGVWNFQPAIGVNSIGDVCIVFTQSSSSIYPRMMVTARNALASTFPQPIEVKASPNFYVNDPPGPNQRRPRWGDFARVSVDPESGRFWVASEYSRSSAINDWGTWWAYVAVAPSQWIADGVGLKIEPASVIFWTAATSDGAGGAYVAWPVSDFTLPDGVYLSRVTAAGALAPGWSLNGLELYAGGGDLPQLAPDGSGGVYAAFRDAAQIPRVQRALSDGTIAAGWPIGGIPMAYGGVPAVDGDGQGGVFVGWTRYVTGVSAEIRLQRLTSSGSVASGWPSNGALVATAPFSTSYAVIAADGAGGAFVSYENSAGITVRRIDATGAPHASWPSGGVVITGSNAKLVADGLEGVYIVYIYGSGSSADLYAQHRTGTGAAALGWSPTGYNYAATPGQVQYPVATSDGAGGFLAAWFDYRDNVPDIYAIRVRPDGQLAYGWPDDGTPVAAIRHTFYNRDFVRIANDGTGGAVVSWMELRNLTGCSGPIVGCDWDIYANRINAFGAPDASFPVGGSAVSAVLGTQQFPVVTSSPGAGAVVAWEDNRSSPFACGTYCSNEVYAQRVQYDGVPPLHGWMYVSTSTRRARVSWPEAGDDGSTGPPAAEVQIRYSTTPINTDEDFFAASLAYSAVPDPPPAEHCVELNANLNSCMTYYFSVRSRDEAGNWSPLLVRSKQTYCSGYHPMLCAYTRSMPAVDEELPEALAFEHVAQNPTRGPTSFRYSIPQSSAGQDLDITVFDVAGRSLRTLARGPATPGTFQLPWDLRMSNGELVRPGMLFVRMTVGRQQIRRTVVVLD